MLNSYTSIFWTGMAGCTAFCVTVAYPLSASEKANEVPMQVIKASDIPTRVVILGQLGRPLGAIATVRGKWVKPGIRAKDRSLIFEVSRVDDHDLDAKVTFHRLQVAAVLANHDGQDVKADGQWDWRVDWRGRVPAPSPLEGDVWEVLAVETGSFDSYGPEAWKEIGPPAEQAPPFAEGFRSRLEFIAMKRRDK